MESKGPYDPTLPLDFDGSSNMIDLPEVTLGGEPSSHEVSASSSRSIFQGSGLLLQNLVTKSNSGRMSPVRGRTMKEYDQQITDLKKENFSLKLRIYFLEERMQQKFGDGEDVFKTNIELKVNVQSLRKELEDKQELLRKASQAIEMLTSSQESDIDSVRKSLEEQHHKYTEELRSDLQKALQDAEDARDEVEAGRERISELELHLQQLEMDQQQSTLSTQKLRDAIDMKEREISALQLESDCQQRGLEEAQRQVQEMGALREVAQHRVQQLQKDVQRRGRDVERLSIALKDTSMVDGQSFLAHSHFQDEVEDQRDNLGQLEARVAELQGLLRSKEDMIGNLEEGLKEKEKAWKDLSNQLQQVTKEVEEERGLGARRDRTILGLVSSLHKKDKEVASVKARLSKSEGALKTMRAELHEAEMANHQDQDGGLVDQLAESENSNRRLRTQLNDTNVEVENMIKSLGKKEGELAGFREQLQQANHALKCSEEALEGLQEQLERERTQAQNSQDRQAQDHKRLVEGHLQQLEGKDSLLSHMTAQLRAKDHQLSSVMDLLTDDTNKGQKVLLQKLEDDMNRSSGNAQSALEEKQAEVDRKGRELREARQALQDKGRQLEQAQLQLLEKREEMEKLDLRHRQQGEATDQLSNTLAKAQQSLEEGLDRHARVLQERDAMIDRLQRALTEKERMLEELTNQSPAIDKQQQQLRAQLREKDQLIQELQTDCVKASCEREQALRASQTCLREKEEEIQVLGQKHQKELLNHDQEIQQLSSRLGKQELQGEGLQSRLHDAETVHREAEHSMRRMLAEKDKTIEALVDSVGEKERLLRRSQQNLTEDAKTQMAEMDTLLAENSRLKRLLREKEDALQEELRRRNHHDNGESHHSSHYETVTHTHTADNAEVCRLLEEQLRETQVLKELLRQDRHQSQVLVNLTSDHHHQHCRPSDEAHSREEGGGGRYSSEALQAELSAVSALRQRLQEGLEKSHQLHRSLLGHTARHADHPLSGDSSPDHDRLPRSLNIPRAHQQQQQERGSSEECDGCPGIGSSGVGGGAVSSKPAEWSHQPVGDVAPVTTPDKVASGSGGQRTSSLAVQTSPFLTHTLFECGGPLSWEGEGVPAPGERLPPTNTVAAEFCVCSSGAGEGQLGGPSHLDSLLFGGASASQEGSARRETSQDSVVSSVSSVSLAGLAAMSAPVLRDLVSQLQEDLIAAAQHNTALQRELQSTKEGLRGQRLASTTESGVGLVGVEGGASTTTAEDMQEQVESLRKALQLKEEETAWLRRHLGLPSDPSSPFPSPSPSQSLRPADLHSQAHHLQGQVKGMNKVNSALRQHIDVSRAASACGQDSSTDSSGGMEPQQVVSRALEIERLRGQNARLGLQLRELQHKQQEGGDAGKSIVGVQEVCDGTETGGTTTNDDDVAVGGESGRQVSDVSLLSTMSPAFSSESFTDDLSRNTNRHADSTLSQVGVCQPWGSGSAGQLFHSDVEWAPRLMQGEGTGGGRLPPLAKMKLGGKECVGAGGGSSPMLNVGRRLHETQEQVKSLEDRLAATEGTVRYMSQRLRYYRSLLQAVGTGGGGGEEGGGVGGQGAQGALAALGLSRSQSESCLFPQSRLSLSLSCSDLREAAQGSYSIGGLGADYSGGADLSAVLAAERGMDQSAPAPEGQKSLTPSKNAHAILNTLSQHIKAMRERYPPGVDAAGKQPPASAAGSPLQASGVRPRPQSTQHEEDGGSNMSRGSPSLLQISRETARRDPAGAEVGREGVGGQSSHIAVGDGGGGKKEMTTGVSDNSTAITVSEVSGSEWTHNQATTTSGTTATTPLLSCHGNSSRPSLSPHETTFTMTLGEDMLDGTAFDNLTYSSFSESILPVGGGHRDSAWGLPPRSGGMNQQGRHRALTQQGERRDVGDKDGQSAENTGGDDDVTYDGNGTLHAANPTEVGEGSVASPSASSRDDSSHLKARVMVLSDMNRTLREELCVYDALCRSLGVQVSLEGLGPGEGSGDESCDGEMRLLQLHLAELKRLRARLEKLDTDAHNAMQVTSLLNSQHLQHIAQLEAAVAALREELGQQRALSRQCQSALAERERLMEVESREHGERREREGLEMLVVRQQQERELLLLRENLAALQDCEVQRSQQQEAEVGELQQQMEALRSEAEEARQRVQELEEELEESQQRRQSYDTRFSQSQQHLQDLESQLLRAKRRAKSLEAELHKSQLSCQDLQSQLSATKAKTSSLDSDLRSLRQSGKKLESELKESGERVEVLETRLSQSEKGKAEAERELGSTRERLQSVEKEAGKLAEDKEDLARSLQEERERLAQQKEEACRSLREERERLTRQKEDLDRGIREEREKMAQQKDLCLGLQEERDRLAQQSQDLGCTLQEEREHRHQLQSQLAQARAEREHLEERVSRSAGVQEECRQQQQRAQHYQERMAHYEQCMREYQHRVHDCEAQVEQLKSSLQSSESREQDAGSRLHMALGQVSQLQGQVKEAESRAHRSNTLVRTLENRLRESEAKVKESEERAKESEYELRVSHSSVSELSMKLETLHREVGERSAKLKKRDAQLKKLVEEYKRVIASQKEMSQLNSTLKTEIKLYESLTSKTEVSRDKKEELMRQLLSELSQTRRLAEDLISRLEHSKRYDSPASTAGPEAADGRPSPELKDSPHSTLSETNILRVNTTDIHSYTASHSRASSLSEHSDARHAESTPVCTPLSSPGGSTFSGSGSRPKATPGATTGQEGEASEDRFFSPGAGGGKLDRPKEGDGGRNGAESSGTGHFRSYSHPVSLKYWRDYPLAALSGSAGQPRVEVDSDLRRLFAVSGLEGYEKLKQENGEVLTTIATMQARIADRLKAFTEVPISESLEYSTLRELQMSAQNLKICAEEEGRLLSCFWLTQLPPINPRGEFYDPKLADENENLKVELRKQRSRYDLLAHTVREQQERLHATNTLRKKWETTLYKQLSHTSGILERSKENFDEAGLTPPPKPKPSPRKPGHPIKDKN